MKKTHKTREPWLRAVAVLLNKTILSPKIYECMPLVRVKGHNLEGSVIKKLPIGKIQFATAYMPNMRVSQTVIDNALYGKARAIGQCHYGYDAEIEGSKKESFLTNIFISPTLDNPVQVAEVLLHELIHTMTKGHNHKGAFKWIAQACGLAFTPRTKGHTYATPELRTKLEKIVKQAGKYPHAKWMPNKSYKKQTTRMFKLVSLGVMVEPTEGKGSNSAVATPYVVRASRTVLNAGFPLDPEHYEMYLELNYNQFCDIAFGNYEVKEGHEHEMHSHYEMSTMKLPTGGRGITKGCYINIQKGYETTIYNENHKVSEDEKVQEAYKTYLKRKTEREAS